ncbi:MAG: hypothetical protein U1F87_13570 [Kiritimatiellia bacterium]
MLCFLLSGDRASASTLVESLDLTPGDPAFLYAHAALAYHDGVTSRPAGTSPNPRAGQAGIPATSSASP